MKFTHYVDTHSHSRHSYDAEYPVEELIESAINKGIETFAITDHMDMDWFKGVPTEHDNTAYDSFTDVSRLRKEYEGKIELLAGVEMGQPCYSLEESEKLLKRFDYDIVIGSLHNLNGWKDFSQIDYVHDIPDIYEMLHMYYSDQVEMVEWGKFDTLAHIIYPMRYLVGKFGIYVDRSKIKKDIDELLNALIEKEIALEINTSGLRQTIGTTMPDEEIVRRYYELGGRTITIGSDSHTPQDMGAGIEQGMELAKACGFNSFLMFRKRQPIELPIELK